MVNRFAFDGPVLLACFAIAWAVASCSSGAERPCVAYDAKCGSTVSEGDITVDACRPGLYATDQVEEIEACIVIASDCSAAQKCLSDSFTW